MNPPQTSPSEGTGSTTGADTLPVDVKAIRAGLSMSQPQFAETFGIPVSTLRNWEQGKRVPDPHTWLLLRLIAKYPKEVAAEVVLLRENRPT